MGCFSAWLEAAGQLAIRKTTLDVALLLGK